MTPYSSMSGARNASSTSVRSKPSLSQLNPASAASRAEASANAKNAQQPRRRRFNDTRDLDVLANELQAERHAVHSRNASASMSPMRFGAETPASPSTDSLLAPDAFRNHSMGGSVPQSPYSMSPFNLSQHSLRGGLPSNMSMHTLPTRPGPGDSALSLSLMEAFPGVHPSDSAARRFDIPEGMSIGFGDNPYPTMVRSRTELDVSSPMSETNSIRSNMYPPTPGPQSPTPDSRSPSLNAPRSPVLVMSMKDSDQHQHPRVPSTRGAFLRSFQGGSGTIRAKSRLDSARSLPTREEWEPTSGTATPNAARAASPSGARPPTAISSVAGDEAPKDPALQRLRPQTSMTDGRLSVSSGAPTIHATMSHASLASTAQAHGGASTVQAHGAPAAPAAQAPVQEAPSATPSATQTTAQTTAPSATPSAAPSTAQTSAQTTAQATSPSQPSNLRNGMPPPTTVPARPPLAPARDKGKMPGAFAEPKQPNARPPVPPSPAKSESALGSKWKKSLGSLFRRKKKEPAPPVPKVNPPARPARAQERPVSKAPGAPPAGAEAPAAQKEPATAAQTPATQAPLTPQTRPAAQPAPQTPTTPQPRPQALGAAPSQAPATQTPATPAAAAQSPAVSAPAVQAPMAQAPTAQAAASPAPRAPQATAAQPPAAQSEAPAAPQAPSAPAAPAISAAPALAPAATVTTANPTPAPRLEPQAFAYSTENDAPQRSVPQPSQAHVGSWQPWKPRAVEPEMTALSPPSPTPVRSALPPPLPAHEPVALQPLHPGAALPAPQRVSPAIAPRSLDRPTPMPAAVSLETFAAPAASQVVASRPAPPPPRPVTPENHADSFATMQFSPQTLSVHGEAYDEQKRESMARGLRSPRLPSEAHPYGQYRLSATSSAPGWPHEAPSEGLGAAEAMSTPPRQVHASYLTTNAASAATSDPSSPQSGEAPSPISMERLAMLIEQTMVQTPTRNSTVYSHVSPTKRGNGRRSRLAVPDALDASLPSSALSHQTYVTTGDASAAH